MPTFNYVNFFIFICYFTFKAMDWLGIIITFCVYVESVSQD